MSRVTKLERRFDDEHGIPTRVRVDVAGGYFQGPGAPQDERTYRASISIDGRELFCTRPEAEAIRDMLVEALANG